MGLDSPDNFSTTYKGWVKEALGRQAHVPETKWSESIAVGTKSFVEKIKEKLGARAIGREVIETIDGYELKESENSYNPVFWGEMDLLNAENTYFWNK